MVSLHNMVSPQNGDTRGGLPPPPPSDATANALPLDQLAGIVPYPSYQNFKAFSTFSNMI